ncbi:hypothetical protein SAMN02745216_05112 [Desulfatibacillum alkenivorans DSM 16219]|uniref:SurA N-terminal domain-containing protein n=1 Tax=Desulfatibacillum alkenivorans DSM 16219 TaxID=1121393 RepID=A0A1M7A8B9_9BACT|nr:hypothetical protein [Desulfatibacillum alkenivorans]SHL38972.1 hypothetical protein SAMN02745216_05112 [Desulfatibacillum alkenivorans DSM 16219]
MATNRVKNSRVAPVILAGALAVLLAGVLLFPGCGEREQVRDDALARVGETVLKLPEFNELFELAEAGFSGYGLGYTANRKESRRQFLNQLVEEMFVLEYARVNGLVLTPEALQKAEQGIWRDYTFVNPDDPILGKDKAGEEQEQAAPQDLTEPPEAFVSVLRDQALTFQLWEKGLARRLLLEQAISREMDGRVQVSEEEIKAYLAENPVIPQMRPEEDTAYEKSEAPEGEDAPEPKGPSLEEQKRIARKVLEAQKAQDEYAQWLLELKERFPVSVRPDLL